MTRFLVRDDGPQETVLRFWLESLPGGEWVKLHASDGHSQQCLAVISPEHGLDLIYLAGSALPDLPRSDDGNTLRIKE